MTGNTFSRDELAAAFVEFENTVDRAAQTRDWDPWVDQYTEDVLYVEHAAGTMHGREQVRPWIWQTMENFPGSYMTSFPSLWSVIDESDRADHLRTRQPHARPRRRHHHQCHQHVDPHVRGRRQVGRQEDVYNPLRFVSAAMKWCRKAKELGTLPDVAEHWMQQIGRTL